MTTPYPAPPSHKVPELGRPIGQHEALTDRLADLIRGYPKGLGIVKEFLQNADDAGATRLDLILDLRSHPKARYPSPAYARLAGPALIIANNAVFTDTDFQNLQSIGHTEKRLASGKIGKFGLGFNAAYNVTDHPMLLSRDRLFIFDPHKSVVGRDYRDVGVEFTLDADLWEWHPDLLVPFSAAGLAAGVRSFPATAFRLPLRSPELAAESKISQEAFSADDFAEIFATIEERAADLLLFLQHVEALSVTRISDAGTTASLLEVTTANVEEVRRGRARIGVSLGDDHPALLAAMRHDEWQSRESVYRHHMRVAVAGRVTDVAWCVAVGLYPGPEGVLAQLASEMWAAKDKALPLAGAAARVAPTAPVEGHAYCGLPLPRPTPLPIHVNGFFELDSHRDWLRLNTEAAGTQEHRRQRWNKALLQHGVARAYATLIDALVRDAAAAGSADVYPLLPAPAPVVEDLLPGLVPAVYAALWDRDVAIFRTRSTDLPWRGPATTLTVPATWVDRLTSPLGASGWAIADPPVPGHVAAGFLATQRPLRVVAPKDLRDRWRRVHDVDCELEDADEPAWRRREWVIDLLGFCLDDGTNDLAGLPLALLCDGKLHTFGRTAAKLTFIGDERQRDLYAERPHWFIDPELVERCQLGDCAKAKLVRMTPDGVLVNLGTVVGANARYSVETHDDPDALAGWLERLFTYLAEEKALATPARLTLFKKVALIPDQFGELRRAGDVDTPLWMRAGSQLHGRLLESFRIPVVTGRKGLKQALRAALASSPEPLVAELNGPALVRFLASTIDEWTDATRHASPMHDQLLRFLALSGEQFSDADLEVLRGLPLLVTKEGELVAASDPGVVLPTDVTFPAFPDKLTFLKAESRSRALFKRLRVRKLDHQEFLDRTLNLDLVGVERTQARELLAWVRDNFARVLANFPAERRDHVRHAARRAAFIEGTDGELHAIQALYDPDCAIAREVMDSRAVYPDMAGPYAGDSDLWLQFFRSLGIARTIRADDLLAFVDGAVTLANANADTADFAPLQAVIGYVRDHWEDVSLQKVVDAGEECSVPEALARRAWLPPQLGSERLSRFAGYRMPEKRLYHASELYEVIQGHLVASCAPIVWGAGALPRAVRQGLGIPPAPSLSLVLRHFENLLDRWALPDHGELETATLARSLRAIYQAIGNRVGFQRSDDEDEEENENVDPADVTAEEVRRRLADRPCLWATSTDEFWRPSHSFAQPVPYFGPYRVRLAFEKALVAVDRAYDVLGRREAPEVGDYVTFLVELYERYGADALSAADQGYALQVLRKLSEACDTADGEEAAILPIDLPILVQDGRLVPATATYRDDDPHRRSHIDTSAVPLAHEQIPHTLQRRLRLKSLASSLREMLPEPPQRAADARFIEHCRLLQRRAQAPEFARGVSRLVWHESLLVRSIDLGWLSAMELVPVEPFTIELWLADDHEPLEVGAARLPFHWAAGGGQLLLSVEHAELASEQITKAINARLETGALTNLLPLATILNVDPSRIDAILSQLGIRQLPEDAHDAAGVVDDLEDAGLQQFAADDDSDAGPDEDAPLAGSERDDLVATPEEGDDEDGAAVTVGDSYSGVAPVRGPAGEPRVPDPDAVRSGGWIGSSGGTGPARGRTGGDREPSARRDRVVTYVVGSSDAAQPPTPSDDCPDDELPWNRHIGDAAEAAVAAEELRAGRRAERQAHHNEGFDILSEDPASGRLRYIEVKGLAGPWTERGVGLSAAQYEMARRERDAYWVYVVEYALDADRRRIHRICNPAARVVQYRFDHGWQQLAEASAESADGVRLPQVGWWILRNGMDWGEVLEVTTAGQLTQVRVRWRHGAEDRCVFRPSMMTAHRIPPDPEGANGPDAP